MSATGNFIGAQTALDWGLVNHVVPHGELLPFARKLAADIVSSNQPAVRRILATYDDGELLSGNDAWLVEADVAKAWFSGGQAADLEANRKAVMERGRAQA
jgi:enoyl-CoA hydratase